MPKNSPTEYIVYKFICENPGRCTYYISKRLNMSGGRVRHALSRLEQKGVIKFKFERNNPRIKKLTFPVNTLKLLPKEVKRQLREVRR